MPHVSHRGSPPRGVGCPSREHNDEVLKELGLSEQEIAELHDQKVFVRTLAPCHRVSYLRRRPFFC